MEDPGTGGTSLPDAPRSRSVLDRPEEVKRPSGGNNVPQCLPLSLKVCSVPTTYGRVEETENTPDVSPRAETHNECLGETKLLRLNRRDRGRPSEIREETQQ